jgi:hypothetical protein
MYMVHNAHMLAYAAMMSGREREALAAARAMWKNVPDDALREVGPVFDLWMCSVYDVQKRFGRWDEILAEDPPPSFLPVTMAIWRAHRAIAYAAKRDIENARREHAAEAAPDRSGEDAADHQDGDGADHLQPPGRHLVHELLHVDVRHVSPIHPDPPAWVRAHP